MELEGRDPDPLHKVCALLSGLCLLLAGNDAGNDAMRKDAAFNGRVFLPFLQSSALPRAVPLLIHVPHNDEWVVFRLNAEGVPRVLLRQRGVAGLGQCVLMMTQQRPQNRKRKERD